jgi:hypothetical protein
MGRVLDSELLASFEIAQSTRISSTYCYIIARFLYRCPNLGLHVHGWIADDASANGGEIMNRSTSVVARKMTLPRQV